MSGLLRWGLVFLHCPIPMDDAQKAALVRVAARAYFTDQERLTFERPMFHGEVRATSETVALGSFIGQQFEAEVHLPEGSTTVKFLVTEAQLQQTWNGTVAEA